MTNPAIPAEAVDAAAKAAAKDEDASNWDDESEYYRNGWRNRMQVGLEDAAPHLRAQALEDAADEINLPGSEATGYYSGHNDAGYAEAEHHASTWLRARAEAERGGK